MGGSHWVCVESLGPRPSRPHVTTMSNSETTVRPSAKPRATNNAGIVYRMHGSVQNCKMRFDSLCLRPNRNTYYGNYERYEVTMKMKNWLMEMEEQYYDIAEKCIGSCEHISEFMESMSKHSELMTGLYTHDEIDDILHEMWEEKWSEYV